MSAVVRPEAALVLAVFLGIGCADRGDDTEPTAGYDPKLLRLSDFDGVSRQCLRDHPFYGQGLGGDERAEARSFVEFVEVFRSATLTRTDGAFELALPALLRAVLRRDRLPLPLDRLAADPPVDAELAAALLDPRADEPMVMERVRAGDATGLRRAVLEQALARHDLDQAAVQPEALAELVAHAGAVLGSRLSGERSGGRNDVLVSGPLVSTAAVDASPWAGMQTLALLQALGAGVPGSIRRILVVGPGLDVANPHLGALAPVCSVEPYVLLDQLAAAGRVSLQGVEVDCLDVHPAVCAVLESVRAAAQQGESLELPVYYFPSGPLRFEGVDAWCAKLYTSLVVAPEDDERAPFLADGVEGRDGSGGVETAFSPWRERLSFGAYAAGLSRLRKHAASELADVTALSDEARTSLENRVRRVELESTVRWRGVAIPAAVVSRIQPIEGDVVTERFAEEGSYDLVVCIDVLRYYPLHLRDLAMLNLRRVTRRGGLLITTQAMSLEREVVKLGWRFELSARHPTWRPQYAYVCVKPSGR